eukprot:Skav208214  [mRNA]  locus=scaffold2026:357548:360078:+ [translate_table: standard]
MGAVLCKAQRWLKCGSINESTPGHRLGNPDSSACTTFSSLSNGKATFFRFLGSALLDPSHPPAIPPREVKWATLSNAFDKMDLDGNHRVSREERCSSWHVALAQSHGCRVQLHVMAVASVVNDDSAEANEDLPNVRPVAMANLPSSSSNDELKAAWAAQPTQPGSASPPAVSSPAEAPKKAARPSVAIRTIKKVVRTSTTVVQTGQVTCGALVGRLWSLVVHVRSANCWAEK